MLIEKTFIVPSYYKNFICKADSCRHTCCEGLSINITQEEYLRLVGLDCSKELREKLDLALYVLSHPDEYKYACISPTYTGRCRMLDENGLCLLQKECGADILTRVCKYYPRHPVLCDKPVCSMSNSCEETLELFLHDRTDWAFEEIRLSFDLAGTLPSDLMSDESSDLSISQNQSPAHSQGAKKQKLQRELTLMMADSDASLSDRLQMIRAAVTKDISIRKSEDALTEQDAVSVSADTSSVCIKTDLSNLYKKADTSTVYTPALIRLLEPIGKEYTDLTLPAHRAKEYLAHLVMRGKSFDEVALDNATMQLQTHFAMMTAPVNFHSYISKTIANGMFYHGFPFGNEAPKSSLPSALPSNENLSVLRIRLANALTILNYAVYLLVVFLIANQDSLSDADKLIDLTAAFSRMADLSDFDKRVLAAHSSHDSDYPGGISA